VTESSAASPQEYSPKLNPKVAHTARVWNYWLGGKDNFAADRAVGDQIQAVVPDIVQSARADRAFLGRVVRYLVSDVGIRQFLDIGTGLPTANNTHEVAQALVPECRIVYGDNDPMVLAHARALLTSDPLGETDYIHADAREVDKILVEAARTLDFSRPVALMLLGILNFVGDDAEAHSVVDRLVDAVPSGSYLVVAHPTKEVNTQAAEEALRLWNENAEPKLTFRSRPQLASFFHRLELLEPGVVSCSRWRPEPGADDAEVYQFCAVGRKG